MQIRTAIGPKETASLNSQALREHFLIEKVCAPGEINLVYSHYDRVIIGGATPTASALALPFCAATIFWKEENWASST